MQETFEIGARRMAYSITGKEGRPLVVLGHSLATTHRIWGHQVPLLEHHFRVVAPDLRGHGHSDIFDEEYQIADLADDVLSLVDHLGYEEFSYIGLSISGMIGQVLGAKASSRLQSLVLTSTTSHITPVTEESWEAFIGEVRMEGVESQVDQTIARWFTKPFIGSAPHTIRWISDLIAATPLEGYIAARDAIRHFQASDRLSDISAPTLIIYGEHDPGTPKEVAETLHSGIPGSKLVLFDQAAHLLNVQHPHRYNEEVMTFLWQHTSKE